MYGRAVLWASTIQATTAACTMNDKYRACGAVTRKVLSPNKTLDEMSLCYDLCYDFAVKRRVTFLCDNQVTVIMCDDCKEG
jgi:hypothetical protein